MRICFFSLNRLAFTGGAEKYIIEVGKALNDKGHEVFYLGDCRLIGSLNIFAGYLLNPARIKETLKAFINYRSAISFPPKAEGLITFKKLEFSVFFPFSSTRKKLRKFLEEIDLILVKNEILDMIAFHFLGCPDKKVKKALIIFTSLFYPSKNWRSRIHNFFYTSFFYGFLIRTYDYVIVSNKADISYVNKKYGVAEDKIKYIPYGLNPEEFPFKNIVRKDNLFKILFVGRLEEQKGVDILSQVIRHLSKEKFFPKLKFTIIGDGPWRFYVENLVKSHDNVEWRGTLPREEVKKAYCYNDLLLVISRWETFSYVTLEAQFCGLPVVAFDIPGPQDIIKHGFTGTLVPLADIRMVENAIIYYYNLKCNNESKYLKKRFLISEETRKEFCIGKVIQNLKKEIG